PTSGGPPRPPLVSAPPHLLAAAPALPCPAESRCYCCCCRPATAATAANAATLTNAPTAAKASPTVLTFDAEGRAVDFDVWVDNLQPFLQYDSRDGVSLFDHTSSVSTALAATVDSTVRSLWTTRDAIARLAIRSHLPPAERAHFGQYKTAQSLYDAVVSRYSSPATAALSRLILPSCCRRPYCSSSCHRSGPAAADKPAAALPDAPRPSPTSGGPPRPPLVSAPPHLLAAAPALPCPAESRCYCCCCRPATAATAANAATLTNAPTAAKASPTVLTFDAEGRAVDFDVWVDNLQPFLQYDSRDGVSLFDHTSSVSTALAATVDSTVRSLWTTRDAIARLAIRSHLPPAERAHFGQYKTAQSLYDAVVSRYSSPATAALSRLILPYLFLDLAAFATVADLVAHLRTSDARYRAALPIDQGPLSLPLPHRADCRPARGAPCCS
ncbi:unnamed protein product, partial [Closterium sp. NIES-53]